MDISTEATGTGQWLPGSGDRVVWDHPSLTPRPGSAFPAT